MSKHMNFKLINIIVILFLFITACDKESTIDFVNSQLDDISNGQYRITSGIGCDSNYYIDGSHYLITPNIGKGLYVAYENSKNNYPLLDFIDNREGLLTIKKLPIKDVRNIFIQDKSIYVKTSQETYLITIDNKNLPQIKQVKNNIHLNQDFNKNINFLPVEWEKEFLHNHSNIFLSVSDTKLDNYQPGSTPKLVCVKKMALYQKFEQVDNKITQSNYLSGESIHSYFIFNVDNGNVKYVDKDEFIEEIFNAHTYGDIYLINGIDYYITSHDIMGLNLKKSYEIIEGEIGGSDN